MEDYEQIGDIEIKNSNWIGEFIGSLYDGKCIDLQYDARGTHVIFNVPKGIGKHNERVIKYHLNAKTPVEEL